MLEKHYMDYGTLTTFSTSYEVSSVQIDYNKKGQVYYLTHNGEGKALPFLDRAYISFTYGGKRIEEFDLIAITENSRLERQTSANFSNNVTDYEILHGQFYWGSKYEANELALTLFTDGISQEKLDQFKYWFRAGEIRQLILSQHPNRGILARVKEAPVISMLPFQQKQRMMLGRQQREVIITKYKGSIQLTFTMDEPFWYAIHNFLGNTKYDTDLNKFILTEQWTDANGNVSNELDIDAWRIVAEDRIPTAGVLNMEMLLGQGSEIYYDHPYKYTLSNLTFTVKDTDEQGNAINSSRKIQGTPVANNTADSISIDSGAVAGPFYQKVWIEGEVITQASKLEFIENKSMNDNGNVIDAENIKYKCTVALIPAKAGSTITLNVSNATVKICKFDKQQSKIGDITSLTNQQPTYTVLQDCYLRIEVYDEKNRDIDNILKVLIATFSTGTGASLTNSKTLYVFYSGTAPSLPKISFDVGINYDTNGYINTFNSSFIPLEDNGNTYNTLRLQSEKIHDFKFTLPSIFISYNTVIQKLSDGSVKDQSISVVIQAFRQSVNHVGVRNWIIGCINSYVANYKNENNEQLLAIDDTMIDTLKVWMPYFFQINDSSEGTPSVSFFINNQTGQATATFRYNEITHIPTNSNTSESNNDTESESSDQEEKIINFSSISDGTYIQRQEHIGDMILYNNFVLEERNQLNEATGTVEMWRQDAPLLSHKLTYDGKFPLNNFKFYYKNLYL